MKPNSRLVYSTDAGRICPTCGKPVAVCHGECRNARREPAPSATSDGVVRVRREIKGRQGKTVTTIAGVPLDPDGLRELASELKRQCGTGGSVKDGVIIVQGDHCDNLIAWLHKRGYKAKRTGG